MAVYGNRCQSMATDYWASALIGNSCQPFLCSDPPVLGSRRVHPTLSVGLTPITVNVIPELSTLSVLSDNGWNSCETLDRTAKPMMPTTQTVVSIGTKTSLPLASIGGDNITLDLWHTKTSLFDLRV